MRGIILILILTNIVSLIMITISIGADITLQVRSLMKSTSSIIGDNVDTMIHGL